MILVWFSAFLVGLGLALGAVMAIAQRRVRRRPRPPIPAALPPVSILKPLKGLDANLRENLHSIFTLDYPTYEVVLGAEDPDDPALSVARAVAAEHPDIPSLVVDSRRARSASIRKSTTSPTWRPSPDTAFSSSATAMCVSGPSI
jgi:ceramide glucosyltransferase